MCEHILTEDLQHGIRHIQLHRAEKKNALTTEMYIELEKQLIAAEFSSTVKTIIISGGETFFTAGNDLQDFKDNPPIDETSPVFSLLRTLNKIGKPLIAAVNGLAVGIGTTLLLHCDLVYANRSATFSTPFVNLGCTPEGGSSKLFREMMGHRKASELLLLCESINADKAETAGLITAITESDNAFHEALNSAKALSAKPPEALSTAKSLMKANILDEIDSSIVTEANTFCDRLKSTEAQEAINAFLEKRKPSF